MSQLTDVFSSIANAIRVKLNTAEVFPPTVMASKISQIAVGTVPEPPAGAIIYSFQTTSTIIDSTNTNLSSYFSLPTNTSGIDPNNYPMGITINGATDLTNCFRNQTFASIPVSIQPEDSLQVSASNYMCNCYNYQAPVTIPAQVSNFSRGCYGCNNIREFTYKAFSNSAGCDTDLSNAFVNCTNLIIANLYGVSKVNSLSLAFYNCINLTQVNLYQVSNWGNAWAAFGNCTNLRTLTIPSEIWVNNLRGTFNSCNNLNIPLNIIYEDGFSAISLEETFANTRSLIQPIFIKIVNSAGTDISHYYVTTNAFSDCNSNYIEIQSNQTSTPSIFQLNQNIFRNAFQLEYFYANNLVLNISYNNTSGIFNKSPLKELGCRAIGAIGNGLNMIGCLSGREHLEHIVPNGLDLWGPTNKIYRLLSRCSNYNSPINLYNCTDNNLYFCINGLTNFNSIFVPPQNWDNFDTVAYVFEGWRSFNFETLTLPSNAKNYSYAFANSNFNCPFTVPVGGNVYQAFYDSNMNSEITIPEGVTSIAGLLDGAAKFQRTITIPSSVTNVMHLFANSAYNLSFTIRSTFTHMFGIFDNTPFNNTLVIEEGVTSLSGLFAGAYAFNQPVTIPSSVTSLVNAFSGATAFNSDVIIPDTVTNVNSMFNGCKSYNRPLPTLPSGVNDISFMLSNTGFNQPIQIPDQIDWMGNTFAFCTNFNQPITLPPNIKWLFGTFKGCTNFNQPITFPSGAHLYSCRNLFTGTKFNCPVDFSNVTMNGGGVRAFVASCEYFNSPVVFPPAYIPDGTQFGQNATLASTFENCHIFNQPLTIPNYDMLPSQVSLQSLLQNCWEFNSIVTLGSNGNYNCYQMFANCWSYNQPFHAQNSADLANLFINCTNFGSDLYIEGVTLTSYVRVRGLFAGCNNDLQKNIHFRSELNSIFNKADSRSMVLNAITWTDLPDGNGFYNEVYNIYCYNNYIPA